MLPLGKARFSQYVADSTAFTKRRPTGNTFEHGGDDRKQLSVTIEVSGPCPFRRKIQQGILRHGQFPDLPEGVKQIVSDVTGK